MNPNLERALLLLQQSRHELAENELRQALASEPDDAYAHAVLALCLAKRERFDDATAEARQAIHLAPDFPFAHYAHAHVLHDRNRHKEALAAIQEAIRLDSADADYFALLAAIHCDEKRWTEALEAAEQGLQFDSEHVGCTNYRAIAMVKLGRKAEAGATIDAALARNPDNSATHANQGWTLLEQGEPKKALEHFRESLRLDPQNEWARQGIIEALKARNLIYAMMLKYFLWMSRFPPGVQWGIILGGYFGNRLLSGLAASNSSLAPWLLPLRVVYVAFALMTWLADPLFNLLLRLNPFGRLVLSREETVASNWFGWCLLLALLALAGCVAFGFDFEKPWLAPLIVFGFLLLPLSATFKCQVGWPRKAMAGYTIAMAVIGLGAISFQWLGAFGIPHAKLAGLGGMGLLLVFLFGAMGSPWVANLLISMRPKR